MNSEGSATYTYRELADRIEQELGERPSLSLLRGARAEARRTQGLQPKPRVLLGLPAPLPATSKTAPAAFSVEDVEAWLKQHPRREWNHAMASARERLAQGEEEGSVVAWARDQGLSWQNITDLLVEHDGVSRSKTGVHNRYAQKV